LAFTTSATTTADGGVTGTSALILSATATLDGSGALAGSSALVLDAAGDLANDAAGSATGSADLTFGAVGALSNIGSVPEQPSVSAALVGALEKRRKAKRKEQIAEIAGVARMAFSASGVMRYQSKQVADLIRAVAMAKHEGMHTLDPDRRKRNQKRAILAALMFD
jgi:hypothetical protein